MNFSKEEISLYKKLNTPHKIQDYLDSLPFNFEEKGETCYSPRMVIKNKKALCLEGAFLAAAALMYHGKSPLLMNLKVKRGDDDHTVALFKENGYWGAISKTNHGVLRWRDPVYRSVRELALSYFNEYFLIKNGRKTLIGYSKPIDLSKYGKSWVTSNEDLWDIAHDIYYMAHEKIIPDQNKKMIRRAHRIEQVSAALSEWVKSKK